VDQAILVVGNPTSKSGKGAVQLKKAHALMEKKGLLHEVRHTLPDRGTPEMVSRAIVEEGFRCVAYLGGDGTFNEVAKGVVASGLSPEVRVAMLPSGTANDQGKSFGISSLARALSTNIDTIAAGYTIPMDVGEVKAFSPQGGVLRRDVFFDSLGWGLSAAILAFRNRELNIVQKLPVVRDMYRNHAVYLRAATREFALQWVTADTFAAELTIDGASYTLGSLSDLLINNTIVYAGEWIVDLRASSEDGLFEISPFKGVRDWTSKLILQHKRMPLTEEMLNRIGVSHTPVFKGANIKVQLFRPHNDRRLPAQMDGEEFPASDLFEIRVHPRLLNVIVPKDYHWI
jgi:diacylglycerol kinase family enzyme